jgi:hypothetical protein
VNSPYHLSVRAVPIRTLAVVVLAVLFLLFFNITKHTPALEAVCPFENDPYDAIGSTGIQAAIVFAAVAVFRAFRAPVPNAPSVARRLLLGRTELAAVLAVLITLLGDVVAMVRHPTVWIGSVAGYQLAALVSGLLVLSLVMAALVVRAAPPGAAPNRSSRRIRAVVVSLVAVLALGLYPEQLRNDTALHGAVLTALLGAVLLYVPLWAVVTGLIPAPNEDQYSSVPRWLAEHTYVLVGVVLLGLAVGLAVFGREGVAEGFPHSGVKVLHAALVYMGLEAAGVLIGFLVLCRPLGLLPGQPRT